MLFKIKFHANSIVIPLLKKCRKSTDNYGMFERMRKSQKFSNSLNGKITWEDEKFDYLKKVVNERLTFVRKWCENHVEKDSAIM